MKISPHIFWLCFILLQSIAQSNSYGQAIYLSDSLEHRIEAGSLEEALQKVAESKGITFAYRNQLLENKVVNPRNFKGTVKEVLDYLLISNKLCYTVQNSQIIIHTACRPKSYTVSGYVVESNTQEPIPYVSLSLPDGQTGIIADHEGFFELTLDYTDSYDSLIVSCMGYFRDTIWVKPEGSEGLFVQLDVRTYELPEAVVRPNEYTSVKLGNKKDNSTGSIYLDTHGQQAALYIQNKRGVDGAMKSVEFFLSKKGNVKAPFRIRVYNVDSLGKPGEDLIQDVIIVKPQVSNGWYRVDISHEEIVFPPQGIFIAMEGVFPDDYDYYMGDAGFVDLKNMGKAKERLLAYGQRLGYNRKEGKNTWHYSMSKVWFQLEKKAFGVMMAATIEYKKNTDNYDQEKNNE